MPEKIYGELLPEGAKREESSANVPHRGKIFEINRPVPLSRPLFDGIDSEAVESSGLGEKSDSELGDKSEFKISTYSLFFFFFRKKLNRKKILDSQASPSHIVWAL